VNLTPFFDPNSTNGFTAAPGGSSAQADAPSSDGGFPGGGIIYQHNVIGSY
jgi:hypothetical protein